MRHAKNSRSHFARGLAFAVACCMVLFIVQVVAHGHEKGQQEAACRVCHAAHFDSATSMDALLPEAPLQPSGHVQEITVKFQKEVFAHDSPSRAPPAA